MDDLQMWVVGVVLGCLLGYMAWILAGREGQE